MSGRLSASMVLVASVFAWHGVQAREIALHGPNGDGGTCVASRGDAAVEPDAADARDATPAKPSAKPAAPRAGGGGSGGVTRTTQPPRWHSFLPGMFR
ncbi:hypothetical protein [Luteimonas pelagia]